MFDMHNLNWDNTFERIGSQVITVINQRPEIDHVGGNAVQALAAAKRMKSQWEEDETGLIINATTSGQRRKLVELWIMLGSGGRLDKAIIVAFLLDRMPWGWCYARKAQVLKSQEIHTDVREHMMAGRYQILLIQAASMILSYTLI